MQRLLARNETLVSLILIAFCAVTAWIEPSFLSQSTLFDLLRSSIVTAIRAVKADQNSLPIQNEFFEKAKHPLDTKPMPAK